MRTIRLTRELRSQIYQRAKEQCRGSNPLFEAGMYWLPDGQLGCNIRLRGDREWGGDLERLARLKWLELDDEGLCTLDLYATTTKDRDTRELECNVYVTVDGNLERVLDANTNDRCPYPGYRETLK